MTVAACGRRWGKTECLGMGIASLALDELAAGNGCWQLVVGPSDNQAQLIGGEVLRLLLTAWDQKTEPTEGAVFALRQRPALTMTLFHPAHPGVVVSVLCRIAGRDGRSVRGLFAHRIIVDEADYVRFRMANTINCRFASVSGRLL